MAPRSSLLLRSAAHEDWLDAVIVFEAPEAEYVSRGDLDSVYNMFEHDEQEVTNNGDARDNEQQSEPVSPAAPAIQEHVTQENVDSEPPIKRIMESKTDLSPPLPTNAVKCFQNPSK